MAMSVQQAKAEIIRAIRDQTASREFQRIMQAVLIRDPVDAVHDLEQAVRLARQYVDAVLSEPLKPART